MRAVRIYQSGSYHSGQLLELSSEAAQHVAVVLRMRVGEAVVLFCGDNREFAATIEMIKKRQVLVRLGLAIEKSRESLLAIHLAQAISKGDRMEIAIQKSVELGVASITPLITERCGIKWNKVWMEKKWRQWQAIVIAACEQSGRNQIPLVYQPISLKEYLIAVQASLKMILDPSSKATWRDYPIEQAEIAVLIGPEGGLSEEEIALARHHQFCSLSLGPRILRTETAAITALSVLQAVWGDL